VLWEESEAGICSGYSGNYVRVYAAGGTEMVNRITTAIPLTVFRDGLWAEIQE
jgi:transcriptional regulator of met regulon